MSNPGADKKIHRLNSNVFLLFFLITLLILSSVHIQVANNENTDDQKGQDLQDNGLNYIYGNDNRIKLDQIEFEIGYSEDDLIFETYGNYDIILLPDCELSETAGEPAIPYKIVNIILPDGFELQPNSISIEFLGEIFIPGNYNILPAQAPRPVSSYIPEQSKAEEITRANEFEKEDNIYNSFDFYPIEGFEVLEKTSYQGVQLGHIKIYPIRYWPIDRSAVLFTKINVKIALIEDISAQILEPEFDDQYLRSIVINPLDFDDFYTTDIESWLMRDLGFDINLNSVSWRTRAENSKQTGSNLKSEDVQYVIITNSTNYYSNFFPLAEWKTKKGVPARIVDDGWIKNTYTGNDTQEKIRNFIRDAVNTWETEWVLLGGDISVIPYRGGYGKVGSYPADSLPTDLYYSDLDGNWDADADKTYGETTDNVNLYPDVYVGRAPVETTAQVDNFVSKTMYYERNVSSGYQLEMLFMAEKLDTNTDAGISKDYIGTQFVPTRFNITKLYQTRNNLSKSSALYEMSQGKGIINHAGHCNWYVMSIGSSSLVRSDVDKLTNKNKQGILYTIGCITTAFENNDCIAEHFLLNTKGGTVGFIGNSRYGWYSPGNPKGGPSNMFDQEFFNLLLQKDIYHLGEVVAKHKIKYISSSSSYNTYRWIQYALNLLGDPELPLWTDLPKDLSVTHPDEVYFGPQTVTIQVNDSLTNAPLKDALVCLQGEDVYEYGLTDSNGAIDFYIDPSSNKAINVTATYYNYYPYEGQIKKIIIDTKAPLMVINTEEYGWYNSDPGNVIDVDFDSLGETDLNYAEYADSPSGPWFNIFNKARPKFKQEWNISEVWKTLDDGYNTIFIRCYDSANPNHWVMGNITIKKDTGAPTITTNQAEYGWYTTDPGATIDVDFSNQTYTPTGRSAQTQTMTTTISNTKCSPLMKAEYSVNSASGKWTTIFQSSVGQYTSDWSVLWNLLVDGTNTIYIRLFDEAGNEDVTLDTVAIKRDTLPPKVVIRKSDYGWYSQNPGAIIDIDFTNGGNGSDLDYAQYRVGDTGDWMEIFTSNTTNYKDNWAVDWSQLTEGINTIYVRCFDGVGFEDATVDIFYFKIDETAPKININKYVYGWLTADPGQIIDVDFLNANGITPEQSSLLDYAQYMVFPEPYMGDPGPWRMIFTKNIQSYTANWSVNWNDLKQGNNTIEVQVFDEATNMNASINTIYVLKDIEPPEIIVNQQQYGWYRTDPGNIIDVNFSNLDRGSDLSYAEYRINQGSWVKIADINAANYTDPWGVDWSTLVEGENDIEVRAWDQAGFNNLDTITILKDTVVPEIKINKKGYGWYNSDPGAVINVDFSSGFTGITLCSNLDFAQYRIGEEGEWINIFDSNCSDYSDNWLINWSLLDEGMNEIYLRACDLAGNVFESSNIIIIKKDTRPPSIKINENDYGWFGKESAMGNIIDVDFSHEPDYSGSGSTDSATEGTINSNLTQAQYKVDGNSGWIDIFNTNTQTFNTNWNVSWDILSQGKNTVYIRVFDQAGNIFYDQNHNISVFKDTIPPDVIINEEVYGWYNADPGAVIDVDFSAGNPSVNSPLKTAQFKFGVYGTWSEIFNIPDDTEPRYNYTEGWSIPWSNVKEGQNSIYIRLYDSAGNENSYLEEIFFNRDTLGPEPPILVAPINNGKTTEKNIVHTWLVPKDPGANMIGRYHIQVDTNDDFKNLITDTTTTKSLYLHQTELEVGKYYWRVSAIDTVGNIGEWSTTWNFEIVSNKAPEANLPPTANAGDDIVVYIDEMITFNGSGSSDPENDEMTYLWFLDADTEVDKVGMAVQWRYPKNGSYGVTLEVFDTYGGSDSDSLTVTVLDTTKDSDDDGMSDDWEIYYGLDPNDPKDAMEDTDNDGYLNNMEFVQGSEPMDSLSTPITAQDSKPPKILHKKVVTAQQLNAIKITATVDDEDSGVKEVNLYYKKKTDQSYNSVSMGNENTYSAIIPGSLVTLDDLEYYIEAIDNSKQRNVAYFGKSGQTLKRPSLSNDIDVKVKEIITSEEEPDMMEDFKDMFAFESLEICFIVLILFIVLLVSFGFSLGKAVRAKQLAGMREQRKTIKVTRGDNMVWEGFELEKISEDEDMNLLDDDAGLDDF
jgi:hypothetical protein